MYSVSAAWFAAKTACPTSSRSKTWKSLPWMSAFAAASGATPASPRASFSTSPATSLTCCRTACNRCQGVSKSDVPPKDSRDLMAYVRRSWRVTAIIFSGLFLSLFGSPTARAELKSGEVLSQENWQEAKGLLPDAVLHRFQDGSYRAKIITLPDTLGWGSKFKAATETNAGKFSIDAADSLTDKATNAYPAFLYGYPFPQIDP